MTWNIALFGFLCFVAGSAAHAATVSQPRALFWLFTTGMLAVGYGIALIRGNA